MSKPCTCKTTRKTNNQTNHKTNSNMPSMEPAYVSLNGWNFSRYECQVAMAIKLYIRNSNNATPSDETVGVIINSLRGQVNGVSPPSNAQTNHHTDSTRFRRPSTTSCRRFNRTDWRVIGLCTCRSIVLGHTGSKKRPTYGMPG